MGARRGVRMALCAAAMAAAGCCGPTPPVADPQSNGAAPQGDGATTGSRSGISHRGPLVDAMPVSAETGPDIGGVAHEQVRVVRVRLDRELERAQVFQIVYDVRNSTGASVDERIVIKERSPYEVKVDPGQFPPRTFWFNVYATKGRQGEVHDVTVKVSFASASVTSVPPFDARPEGSN